MATKTFSPVLGKRIRVTKLDECGRPGAPGTPDSLVATDGFISVKLSAETEDGNEIITRKANGAICINEKSPDSFKYFSVEIEFCGVNPALATLLTNAEPYLDDAGDVAGFTVPEGELKKKFALELWTGMAGVACGAGADEASGYMLLPFVQAGVIGDIEINGEDAVTFSMSGAYTKGGNTWGIGPYEVVYNASGVRTALPTPIDQYDHFLLMETGLTPPPESDGFLPMPAILTSTTLTSIAPVSGPAAGGTEVTLTGTGFAAGTTVSFGGTPATNVTYVSATQVKATAPAGSGTVQVTATTGGVTTSGVSYTYV